MNLNFDINLAINYKSGSQIARILTENWVLRNSYCPSCGNIQLNEFENNRPAADFFCKIVMKNLNLRAKMGNFLIKLQMVHTAL